MARGRRGLETETITITSRGRQPRPVDEYDFEADSAVRKAQRFTNHYIEDHDAMSSSSKRQDRALLNDITSRLVNADFARPLSVPRSPRATRKVIPQTVVRGVPIVLPPSPVMVRRASISAPSAGYTIPYATPTASPRLTTKKINLVKVRAGSEPPPRSRPTLLNPTADLAVRQAKRSLHRIENEIGGYGDIEDEPVYIHGGGRSMGGYRGGYPRRAGSVVPQTTTTTTRIHSSPARPHFSRNTVTRRSASLPRQIPRRYMDDIETDVEFGMERDLHPPMSMTTLRSKAVDARSKMDQHRTMLDRYLPLDMSVGNDVQYEVENKYGELVQRMPQLDPYRPKQVPVTSTPTYLRAKPPVAPPRAYNNYGLADRAPVCRPPMSEARRNARAVLCRTKGDPHYFS